MPAAPTPANEQARLVALHNTGILNTAPEASFDAIVSEAAEAAGTPIALISFISADKQWFKAAVGLDETETHRDSAFCAWAIHGEDVLWVEDAEQDPRFADNPLVHEEPNIRHYAGAPISTPDGYQLGTLCVIDRAPRVHDPALAATLRSLASRVSDLLARRNGAEGSEVQRPKAA